MAVAPEIAQEDDPDWINDNPPAKETDPKLHFQVGANEGKWMEYDERGVPTKNIKKKKPTKKEKDALEQEYLEARKKYQQYLKDVEEWELRKAEAEAGLEKTDRLRWAYRQIGEEKAAPIGIEELDEVCRLMNWDQLTKKELNLVRRAAQDQADDTSKLDLTALRLYTGEKMPVLLLEERLNSDAVEELVPEELYSPRTWRGKLAGAVSEGGKKKSKSRASSSKDSPKSPRGGSRSSTRKEGSSPRSPRGEKDKKDKKDKKSPASPRGSPSDKEKKERKESKRR